MNAPRDPGSKTKVLVIGAGPAGLGAAIRLLEEAPDRFDVKLIHQGHHLGGKAASYRDAHGRTVEHGIHMLFGFYDKLRALMGRAGIDESKTLKKTEGLGHVYADWSQGIHELDLSALEGAVPHVKFDGVRDDDKLAFVRFMVDAYLESRADDIERHDDVCFRTWAVERGLDPRLTDYSLFRALRQPYFNYPSSVSAYHVLKAFQLMSTPESAAMYYVRGGFSEWVWDPIGQYLERLGGTIIPYRLALDWLYDGRRVTGVRVARPDGSGHGDGTTSWQHQKLPVHEESVEIEDDFDYVISTVPHAVFTKMNADDRRMWESPYYRRLQNLRSIVTVSFAVATRRPVMQGVEGIIGLPPPIGNVAEMKPMWDEIRDDDSIGSYLYFAGTEGGFEDWTDEEMANHTIDFLSKIPEVGDIRAAGIQFWELHRNRSDFERLILSEPGVNQFRPGPKTPFSNLFLAGDWVRNEVDLVVSMEGALTSGQNAANLVIDAVRSTT